MTTRERDESDPAKGRVTGGSAGARARDDATGGTPEGRQFVDLGGLSFAIDGVTLVSQHYVLGGRQLTVGVEKLVDPSPPWPPLPGEDARTRLSRLLKTVRIRLTVA